MANIAVGVSSKGSGSFVGTATTAAVTTQASGSSFFLAVTQRNSTAVGVTISDSKGNTYTQIGSAVSDTSSRSQTLYYCQNGVGGASHTVQITLASGSTASPSVCFVEILNGASSGVLVTNNSNAPGFSNPPVSSGSVTITPPTTGMLLLSFFTTDQYASSIVFGEANGFTIIQSVTDGTTPSMAWAVGAVVKTASGTYNASWTDNSGGKNYTGSIAVFAGAAASTSTTTSNVCVVGM